jgi:hypothetical protein
MKIDLRFVGRKFTEYTAEILFMVLGMAFMLSMINVRHKIASDSAFFWSSVLAFMCVWLTWHVATKLIDSFPLRKEWREEPPG